MKIIETKKSLCKNENSLWLATTPETNYPALPGNEKIQVDVAVIGGGIAGISTALFLKREGMTVALVESDKIARGVSGYTTGKVTSQHLLIYKYLIENFGFELAKQYADANQEAIETIAGLIKEYDVNCDFSRKTAFTYAEKEETLQKVIEEVEAAKSLGLPAYYTEKVLIPILIKGAICFTNQGQFHPRKYLLKLASKIPGEGSFIFENTRALDLKEGDPCEIITNLGTITAKDIAITTHFPFYDKPGQYYARMEAGRIYTFAMKLKTKFPDGIFISAEKDIYSFRSQSYNEGELVIAGGQEHVTGRIVDTMDRFKSLYNYVRQFFEIESIEFCWSSQDNNTVDMVPYIGRYLPDTKHIYIATGFNGWGMTHGTISGIILKDLILGFKNNFIKIYDPARFKLSSVPEKKLLVKKEKISKKIEIKEIREPSKHLSALKNDEGRIIEIDGKKVAVYKDIDGRGYFLNPVCPHMSCVVRWNNAEKSWDCPCHGSRFSYYGKVLNSPAIEDLNTILILYNN
jgi:glycine/D-amino acid oxidase-like deaminating enzyme/nitrite reductase/ring-hydroxylating ferredoxin subunit